MSHTAASPRDQEPIHSDIMSSASQRHALQVSVYDMMDIVHITYIVHIQFYTILRVLTIYNEFLLHTFNKY